GELRRGDAAGGGGRPGPGGGQRRGRPGAAGRFHRRRRRGGAVDPAGRHARTGEGRVVLGNRPAAHGGRGARPRPAYPVGGPLAAGRVHRRRERPRQPAGAGRGDGRPGGAGGGGGRPPHRRPPVRGRRPRVRGGAAPVRRRGRVGG